MAGNIKNIERNMARTTEEARALAQKRWNKRSKLGEPPSDIVPFVPGESPTLPALAQPRLNTVLTQAEWDGVYVKKTYPLEWRAYYWMVYKDLRRQYAPGKNNVQYRVLCQRAAALATSIHILESNPKIDKDLVLRYDAQLRGYIQALQKYTEAEKVQIQIQQEIMLTALTKVVGIAEATIGDPPSRAAFMRALEYAMSEEGNARNRDILTPLLNAG